MQLAVAAPSSARAVYAQRSTNTLQRVFRDHFHRFAGEYDQRYAKELGNFRIERISRVATRFMTCGDYRQGVAKIRCANPDCHVEYFRPFSCRGFHLCPSCSQKRALLFAEYLDEQLLLALPHRQFVFTLPKALRVFLRYDQRLFGQISRLIFSLVAQFYSTASGRPITGAAVLAFQPFGEALRHNPHFHALILEGGFDPEGRFIRVPIHDTARLTQLFRQRTVGLFLKLGLITEEFAETLLRWRHSGFSVDNSVLLDSGDHRARQALAQYAARAPLSLQKLTYDALGGKVLYHTSYNPYLKQNTSLWSAADFIAQLTQFIPRAAAALARREPLPGEYVPSTISGCMHRDAKRNGSTGRTWRRLRPAAGRSPMASTSRPPRKPRLLRRRRFLSAPAVQRGPG